MQHLPSQRINPRLARLVFDDAFAMFLHEEGASVANEISEQNSCGRLAIYLTEVVRARNIAGYYADVEYNRKQDGQIKTIINDQAQVLPVRCDLILHSRDAFGLADNFIAIEMKKDRRPRAEREADCARLQALTRPARDLVHFGTGHVPRHVSGYQLGAFVLLCGRRHSCSVQYFVNGRSVEIKDFMFD